MKKVIILLMLVLICLLFYFRVAALKLYHRPSSEMLGSVVSSSFENNAFIPMQYTCDGENISPGLSWHFEDAQQVVGSYVLIVDDPDAQKVVGKTFVHWVLLLPLEVTRLPEKISGEKEKAITEFNSQIVPLQNSYQGLYYKGPCPPAPSGVHSYYFTIFALNKSVQQMQSMIKNVVYTADEFADVMREHIVGKAVLVGRYGRQKDA